jgi:anti-sigma B factor antagonist
MLADCRPDGELTNAVVATLEGLFDEAGAATLWETVTPHVDAATSSLLIDLSGVRLITSAGVGVLVRLLHRVQSLGGGMVVFGAGSRVRDVIGVVRLEEVLNLSASIGEARQRLRARQ